MQDINITSRSRVELVQAKRKQTRHHPLFFYFLWVIVTEGWKVNFYSQNKLNVKKKKNRSYTNKSDFSFFPFLFVFFRRGLMGMFWLWYRPKHWRACVWELGGGGLFFLCVYFIPYIWTDQALFIVGIQLLKPDMHFLLKEDTTLHSEILSIHTNKAIELLKQANSICCYQKSLSAHILCQYKPFHLFILLSLAWGHTTTGRHSLLIFQLLKLVIIWIRCSWEGKSPNCTHHLI